MFAADVTGDAETVRESRWVFGVADGLAVVGSGGGVGGKVEAGEERSIQGLQ
jgi:hypothetical protein